MKYIYINIILVFIFSTNIIFAEDNFPPEISVEFDGCSTYYVTISDVGDGIFYPPKIKKSTSKNISEFRMSNEFREGYPNFNLYFEFDVTNNIDSAVCEFSIFDGEYDQGNLVFKHIDYIPNLLNIQPELLYLPATVVNRKYYDKIILINDDTPIIITDLLLTQNKQFRINDIPKFPDTLKANERLELSIIYSPQKANINIWDTLIIKTNCKNKQFKSVLKAYNIKPNIVVDDIDFGVIQTNKEYTFKDFPYIDGIKIENKGSGLLVLKNREIKQNKYFKFTYPDEPYIPDLSIGENQIKHFKSIKFSCSKSQEIRDTIVFQSNALISDSICVLRAFVVPPGIFINSYNFDKQYIHSNSKQVLKINNTGNIPIKVIDIKLSGNINDFTIIEEEILPKLKSGKIVYPKKIIYNGTKEIRVPISFSPQKESLRKVKITVRYVNQKNDTMSMNNYIIGTGILPKLQVSTNSFTGSIPLGEIHKDTVKINLHNISNTAPLIIKSVSILRTDSGEDEFIFLNDLPIDKNIRENESFTIPLLFKSQTVGHHSIKIKIRSNANSFIDAYNFKDTIITIMANSYKRPIFAEIDTLISINKCDIGILNAKIYNIIDDTITINSIEIIGSDSLAFFMNLDKTENININPMDSLVYEIQYLPNYDNNNNHNVKLEYSVNKYEYNTNIIANNYKSEIYFFADTIYNYLPGGTINKYNNNFDKLGINISADNLQNLFSNIIKFELHYDEDELFFNNAVGTDNSNKYKNISFDNKLNYNKLSVLTITAELNPDFDSDSYSLYPRFRTLLTDLDNATIHINPIFNNNIEVCSNLHLSDGKIFYNYCGMGLGSIFVSNTPFDLLSVIPNPASTHSVQINISVSFKAHTKIEIINSIGKTVITPLDDEMEEGEYAINVPIEELASGTYIVLFIAGPYTETMKLLIEK